MSATATTPFAASLRDLADLIRTEDLDGQDLHDISGSVDLDEPEYIGAGQETRKVLITLGLLYNKSASDLIEEACEVLGW